MGQGCTEATVEPGAQLCFDLAVQAVPGHGGACVTDYECPGAAGGSCCNAQCADLNHDVASCGACGAACDQATTVGARCDAGACRFDSCKSGRLDCNQHAADGCECAGNACCGTGGGVCQSAHANGVGGTFYDCVPLYTYDSDEAGAAFDSATNYQGGALIFTCFGGASGDHATALCKSGTSTCVCWWYDGAGGFANAAGLVSIDNTSGDCWCPDASSDPSWH
jgi:hypothetical protein